MKIRTFGLIFCLLWFFPMGAQTDVTLVSPANKSVTGDTTLLMVWNTVEGVGSVTYQIQCAADSLFSALLHDHQGLTINEALLSFSLGDTIYWRVRHYQGGVPESWSETYRFTIFTPALLPGVVAWLETDTGITSSGGLVQSWQSRIGSYSLDQTDTLRMPLLSDTMLMNKPAIVFDGINDFLQGSFLNYNDLSIIALHNPEKRNSSIVSQARFTYTGFNWFISNTSRPSVACLQTPANTGYIFNGEAYPFTIPSPNLSVDAVSLNSSGVRLFTGLKDTVSTQTISYLDNPALTSLRVGAMGNNSSFYEGNFYALIIADSSLGETMFKKAFEYLLWKYQPPVSLGPNRNVGYGLCEITLEPTHHYRSYHWSTGDTTHSITVQQAGTYWVQVTDYFGRVSSDTILLTGQRPFITLNDTVICLGDTIQLHPGISGAYSYIWNHDPLINTPSFAVSDASTVHITVTDSLGCHLSDSATIIVDQYPAIVSLGPDRTACLGNPLSLTAGASLTTSYQWSTGIYDTLPFATITGPGLYSVTTTNSRGCVGTTQVNLSVTGISPAAQFQLSASPICLTDTLLLTDMSISDPQDPISSWQWQIGSAATYSSQGPISHTFSTPGVYQLNLTIETDSGCVNTSQQLLLVRELPNVDITPKKGCSGQAVTFGFDSLTGPAPTSFLWHFNPDSTITHQDTTANPQYTWPYHGHYQVALLVTDQHGCVNSDTFQITIHESPIAQISVDQIPTCPGNELTFTETGPTNPLLPKQYWFWSFGDGTPTLGTIVNNANHTYHSPGIYPVSVLTGSMQTGCSDSATMMMQVNHLPDATISDAHLCTGEVKALNESSTVTGDTITSWSWWIEEIGQSNHRFPSVSFQQAGSYLMKLTVETATGCIDSTEGTIYVHPRPTALFASSPAYGTPPLMVAFENRSILGDVFSWQFGDGNQSLLENPTHTFTTAELFNVSLRVETQQGCSDTYTDGVFTDFTMADLELVGLEGVVLGNTIQPIMEIRNNSPFEVMQVEASTWLSSGSPMAKTWTSQPGSDRLLPGKTIRVPFSSRFVTSDEHPGVGDIICAHVMIPEFPIDNIPENNKMCVNITRDFTIKDPWPNPATTHVHFDLIINFADLATIELMTLHGTSFGTLFEGPLQDGLNRITVPIPHTLAGGVYVFVIRYRNHTVHKKVIIQPKP